MIELTPDKLDEGNWYLSLMLPEQVGEVANLMYDEGASYEEIGEVMMLHLHTSDDRRSGTTVFTLGNTDGKQGGVVVMTDHGNAGQRLAPQGWDESDAVAKVYGIGRHETVDEVVDKEMLSRGTENYTVEATR